MRGNGCLSGAALGAAQRRPPSKEYVVALDRPKHEGDLCSQGTVQIERKDVGDYEKLVQDLQHGSQEWDDRCRPARSMVEGYNGFT